MNQIPMPTSVTRTPATPPVEATRRALLLNCSRLSRRLFEAQAQRIELLNLTAKQQEDLAACRSEIKAKRNEIKKLKRQVDRSAALERSKLGRLQRRFWKFRASLRRGGTK